MTTSAKTRAETATALFAEKRVIHALSTLRKANSSPEYDGASIKKRASRTVSERALRYSSALTGLVRSQS